MMAKKEDRSRLLKFLARTIRAERRKNEFSMEQLAELSHVSLQTIKDIEYGKRACQIDTLVSIASALDLSTDNILGIFDITIENDTLEFEIVYHSLGEKEKYHLYEIAKMLLSIHQDD